MESTKVCFERFVTCSTCGETAGMMCEEKSGWIIADESTLKLANIANARDRLPTLNGGFGHKNRCAGQFTTVTPISETRA